MNKYSSEQDLILFLMIDLVLILYLTIDTFKKIIKG